MVFITITLSPSTTISENPASMAKITTFRHANAFASSLFGTKCPFTDIPAIISPYAFQIIAQNPKHCWSEKTDVSKLSLNRFYGGGFHCCPLGATIEIAKCSCAFFSLQDILLLLCSANVDPSSVRHAPPCFFGSTQSELESRRAPSQLRPTCSLTPQIAA